MKELIFYIDDMECIACSTGIEKALAKKKFVESVSVDLLSKKARVVFDEKEASEESIFAFVKKMGFKPYFSDSNDSGADLSIDSSVGPKSFIDKFNAFDAKLFPPKLRLIIMGICSAIVLVLVFTPMFFGKMLIQNHALNSALLIALSLIVAHMARDIFFRGWKGLFALAPNMDSLVALGTTAAFVYSLIVILFPGEIAGEAHGYFESIVVILFFLALGKNIEGDSKNRALASSNELLKLSKKQVLKVVGDVETLVDSAEIKKGEIISINTGEMVAVDGILISDAAMLDTSSINGESLPVVVSKSAKIISGSVNLGEKILLKATLNGADSKLAKIALMIETARASKMDIARSADRLAGILVPVIIILALAGAIFWGFYSGIDKAIEVFLSVLVITCPCALGLAMPMAVLNAQAAANRHGAFLGDAAALEVLGDTRKFDCVVFDKTGTLSEGLEVVGVEVLDSAFGREKIIGIAKSLESLSFHVIADAFRAMDSGTLLPVSNFKEKAGFGVLGEIEGKAYALAKAEFFGLESGADFKDFSAVSKESSVDSAAKIAVFLGEKTDKDSYKIIAKFALKDRPKNSAKAVLEFFKNKEIYMLSGDNKESVASFAKRLGIKNFCANALPEDKIAFIENLQKSGKKVVMVGDGINDAAALAKADVSIAFNVSALNESLADVVISRLDSVVSAVKIAQKTLTNIKQNLFWAFGYNALFVPLALGFGAPFGLGISPMFCALAMSLSSLSVVANASRLRKIKL